MAMDTKLFPLSHSNEAKVKRTMLSCVDTLTASWSILLQEDAGLLLSMPSSSTGTANLASAGSISIRLFGVASFVLASLSITKLLVVSVTTSCSSRL